MSPWIERVFDLGSRRLGRAGAARRGRDVLTMSSIVFVQSAPQHAIAGGIGLFVAFIGLMGGGLVAKHPAPGAYVQIGDLASPLALTTLADGARTGLANVATAALFLLALCCAPLVSSLGDGVIVDGGAYYPVTAPVIVLVGRFMLAAVARIAWDHVCEAAPAFLTLVLIPFTFNVAHGVAADLVAHVAVRAGAGRARARCGRSAGCSRCWSWPPPSLSRACATDPTGPSGH